MRVVEKMLKVEMSWVRQQRTYLPHTGTYRPGSRYPRKALCHTYLPLPASAENFITSLDGSIPSILWTPVCAETKGGRSLSFEIRSRTRLHCLDHKLTPTGRLAPSHTLRQIVPCQMSDWSLFFFFFFKFAFIVLNRVATRLELQVH